MSGTTKFDVVFRGDIAPGQKVVDVRERVQKLFKADEQQLQRLFSGRPVTIRSALDQAQAEQYEQALLQAGALVEVKPSRDQVKERETPVPAQEPSAPRQEPSASVQEPALIRETQASPDAETEAPAQGVPEDSGEFTVAPVGADMLREEDRPLVDAVDVDISGLSAETPAGDLLNEGEKKPVQAVDVDTSHLSVEELSPK